MGSEAALSERGLSRGSRQEQQPSLNAHHSLKVASPTLQDSHEDEEALKYIFGSSVHICFLFDMFCQHFCENTAISRALEAAESSRSGNLGPSAPLQWTKRRKRSCILVSVLPPSPH